MASTITRKRARSTARTTNPQSNGKRYLVDEQGKRIAIVLDLAEYRQLLASRRASNSSDFDWLAEARRIRALSPLTPDSTPILRALREGKLR